MERTWTHPGEKWHDISLFDLEIYRAVDTTQTIQADSNLEHMNTV